MKPRITIRRALADPQLLGAGMTDPSWDAWKVVLIAAMGEALTDEERVTFQKLTGRPHEPGTKIDELCAIVGRRGGKTRGLSVLSAYIAGLCSHDDVLTVGETGVCLLVAQSQNTAKVALDYITGIFQASPILRQLIAVRNADELRLTNNISVQVRTASFRRLRGPTFICVLGDEVCFWLDDSSANPDKEILAAVRPGLATTKGPLIIASSPYSKRGVVWDTFKRHYGAEGDPLILVCKGASRDFNPSLSEKFVARELEKDPEANRAEYLGEFRNDLANFVSIEIIQGCVGDYTEQLAREDVTYSAFCDPSGGSSDSFSVAVSHREGHRDDSKIFIDCVREIRPPFSPQAVIDEFSNLLHSYGISKVSGDRYAGEFPRELFRKNNINYVCAEKPKSDLYRDMLPLLNSGRIVLPKSERLVNQLCGLERRTSRAGRDSIDHAPNSKDDVANAVAGAADAVAIAPRWPSVVVGRYGFVPRETEPTPLQEEMAKAIPPCLIDFNAINKKEPTDGREI